MYLSEFFLWIFGVIWVICGLMAWAIISLKMRWVLGAKDVFFSAIMVLFGPIGLVIAFLIPDEKPGKAAGQTD